ncbi:replication associated protein [Lake Sarah-associated circular virus-18]|uniref:replication associated protein n=1 Tax=Lake Sarah-associated circular virus-18 TaxID=1685744 RepID=UPI0007772EAB|nr:replication associated protein [Lake Sarah-associated circular virus-18]ALE29644.1 replication associated protein [Lake Sarah-associated circular virus-18]
MTSLLPTDSKSTRWAFTAFESQYTLFNEMPAFIAQWGWQQEVSPTTGKPHFQGYFRTTTQVRFAYLKRQFPGVHLEIAKDWESLKKYCNKAETAIPGTQVQATSNFMNMYDYLPWILLQTIDTYGWQELWDDSREEYIEKVMYTARAHIASGNTWASWIIQNPNFKQNLKENGRAILLGFKHRQTDRQTE